ncbi:MAG: protein BatD [Pseudomonadales bacterium]|nr:protein BatD [Pseudomonadales bacterium]
MVNLLAGLLMVAITLFSSGVQAQPVSASLDRTEIVRGETVTLTIRVEGQQGGVQMDLTPLERSFQVVATRTSSQMRSINNSVESWIDYNLTLFPLHEGEIEVPALNIAGEMTQPLSITVQPKTETGIAGQELFMEAVVDKESVYVQEQLLFTIRLYYTINGIRNPIFTDLDMPDTVIQMIGTPNQYEKLIDGVRYGVYEKQYALFPQLSGTMEIPDIMFRGEVTDGSSRYVFRNLNTRTITSFAEGHTITVKEKPANYPANAVWLPARDISIRERWDNDLSNVRVGDAVTRTIEIKANGLDGAALPPLDLPSIDTVNTYPEPPQISRTYIDGNVVGERVETNSLLMTAAATVRIPGVSLPWFDIDTEEVKYATIEDSAVRVGPVRTTGQDDPLQLSTDANGNPVADGGQASLTPSQTSGRDPLVSEPTTPLWILALAAALTALLGVITYFTAQRRSAVRAAKAKEPEVSAPMYRQSIAPESEALAFREFTKACEQKHLPALRLALIGWGRQYFADSDLHNLDELARRTGNPEIRDICVKLQQALYGENSLGIENLQGDIQRLCTLITELRTQYRQNQAQTRKDQDFILPPLYKA